ncbi:hypothetical protein Taro_001970 [Colocasia esculenta]|uniref:Uncharacterized protein n=1 Tax=Colocasia esculenta TaxID=4460 RepID=A0A843TCR1_COLES|nr:hypothetical protein [Colocasia esculenta]
MHMFSPSVEQDFGMARSLRHAYIAARPRSLWHSELLKARSLRHAYNTARPRSLRPSELLKGRSLRRVIARSKSLRALEGVLAPTHKERRRHIPNEVAHHELRRHSTWGKGVVASAHVDANVIYAEQGRLDVHPKPRQRSMRIEIRVQRTRHEQETFRQSSEDDSTSDVLGSSSLIGSNGHGSLISTEHRLGHISLRLVGDFSLVRSISSILVRSILQNRQIIFGAQFSDALDAMIISRLEDLVNLLVQFIGVAPRAPSRGLFEQLFLGAKSLFEILSGPGYPSNLILSSLHLQPLLGQELLGSFRSLLGLFGLACSFKNFLAGCRLRLLGLLEQGPNQAQLSLHRIVVLLHDLVGSFGR